MSNQQIIKKQLEINKTTSIDIQQAELNPRERLGSSDAFGLVKVYDWTLLIKNLPKTAFDVIWSVEWESNVLDSYRFIPSIFEVTSTSEPNQASISEKFSRLANRWHNETDFLSSPSRITNNDNYVEIISMGSIIIPLILKDLNVRGGDWFRALRILSNEDPVPVEAQGDVEQMKSAWFTWGRDRGYIE
jgi:hypothetical protein